MKKIFQFIIEFIISMIIAFAVTLFVVAIIGQSTMPELIKSLIKVISVYRLPI